MIVIGLSRIQIDLQSYQWLANFDNHKYDWTTQSPLKIIRTITKFEEPPVKYFWWIKQLSWDATWKLKPIQVQPTYNNSNIIITLRVTDLYCPITRAEQLSHILNCPNSTQIGPAYNQSDPRIFYTVKLWAVRMSCKNKETRMNMELI